MLAEVREALIGASNMVEKVKKKSLVASGIFDEQALLQVGTIGTLGLVVSAESVFHVVACASLLGACRSSQISP